ncbi:hypothetical protein NQ839_00815 [Acinetobacter baumannii]|nr:hypothetical protein [Acinetobacter baumannii]
MTLNERVNLRFEQDDGVVWVFDGDSQFGTEISHLMMMHADEYKEDELRVICNHAACEIDRLRAELEKAKAQAVPEHINEIQSWIAVQSTQAMELDGEEFVVGANELAEFIEQLVKSESGAEG